MPTRKPIAADPRRVALREAIGAYVTLPALRAAVAQGGDLFEALRTGAAPEAEQLIALLSALVSPEERAQIKSPADVAALLMAEMGHLDHEELRVVILDTKNRVQRIATVYSGSVNSAQIRTGELFRDAIRLNAVAIILVHNHPSGEPTPSPEDILVTRQAVEAGRLLDVEVLDHLVIGRGIYVSMRTKGMGFPV